MDLSYQDLVDLTRDSSVRRVRTPIDHRPQDQGVKLQLLRALVSNTSICCLELSLHSFKGIHYRQVLRAIHGLPTLRILKIDKPQHGAPYGLYSPPWTDFLALLRTIPWLNELELSNLVLDSFRSLNQMSFALASSKSQISVLRLLKVNALLEPETTREASHSFSQFLEDLAQTPLKVLDLRGCGPLIEGAGVHATWSRVLPTSRTRGQDELRLEELFLSGSFLQEREMNAVAMNLRSWPDLKTLDIADPFYSDELQERTWPFRDMASHLSQSGNLAAHLQKLCFGGHDQILSQHEAALLASSFGQGKITRLSFVNMRFEPGAFTTLIPQLVTLNGIEVLDCEGIEGLQAFGVALASAEKRLERFVFARNRFTEGQRSLMMLFQTCWDYETIRTLAVERHVLFRPELILTVPSALRILSLKYTPLNEAAFRKLLDALPVTLLALVLADFQNTHYSLIPLLSALPGTSIRALLLRERLGLDFMKRLQVVVSRTQLESLTLAHCSLDQDCGPALIHTVLNASHLYELDLISSQQQRIEDPVGVNVIKEEDLRIIPPILASRRLPGDKPPLAFNLRLLSYTEGPDESPRPRPGHFSQRSLLQPVRALIMDFELTCNALVLHVLGHKIIRFQSGRPLNQDDLQFNQDLFPQVLDLLMTEYPEEAVAQWEFFNTADLVFETKVIPRAIRIVLPSGEELVRERQVTQFFHLASQ